MAETRTFYQPVDVTQRFRALSTYALSGTGTIGAGLTATSPTLVSPTITGATISGSINSDLKVLAATGHAVIPCVDVTTVSAAFDITAPTNIGVCLTGGASDSVTIQLVMAEAWNL